VNDSQVGFGGLFEESQHKDTSELVHFDNLHWILSARGFFVVPAGQTKDPQFEFEADAGVVVVVAVTVVPGIVGQGVVVVAAGGVGQPVVTFNVVEQPMPSRRQHHTCFACSQVLTQPRAQSKGAVCVVAGVVVGQPLP